MKDKNIVLKKFIKPKSFPQKGSKWQDRIRSYGKDTCCVCDRKFKKKEQHPDKMAYLGHIFLNGKEEDLFYHKKRCNSLSTAWKKKFAGCTN